MLSLVVLPFAEAKGAKSIAACADKHRECKEYGHSGRGDGNGRQAHLAGAMAQKDRVNEIVRAVHHHAQDGGDSELHDKLGNAARAHPVHAIGYRILFVRFRAMMQRRTRRGARNLFGCAVFLFDCMIHMLEPPFRRHNHRLNANNLL